MNEAQWQENEKAIEISKQHKKLVESIHLGKKSSEAYKENHKLLSKCIYYLAEGRKST